MNWNGEILKLICEERGLSKSKLAESLAVSRQTVYSWFADQVPKGHHLLKLCEVLDIEPMRLFKEQPLSVSVPAHRVRSNAKVTESRRQLSYEMASEFASLFQDVRSAEILPVIRTAGYGEASVLETARKLRELAEVPDEKHCTYEHAFRLLNRLGCYAVFLPFPAEIKSYAFYSEVHKHRLIFVNRHANVLDLVFVLLHEAVHAAFDEQAEISAELEVFCDAVAGAVQFPPEYVHFVSELLKGLDESQQMQTIKKLAVENGHALYGLTKTLFPADKKRHQSAARRDNTLRKQSPEVDDFFFKKGTCSEFINRYRLLSPLYYRLIEQRAETLSARRVGELMGLESELDAAQVKTVIQKMRES